MGSRRVVAGLLQSSVEPVAYLPRCVVLFARCNPWHSRQRSVRGILPERGVFSATFTDVLPCRPVDSTRKHGMRFGRLAGLVQPGKRK